MRFRKYDRAADGDWENCVWSQGATLKGTEASLSYVQCFLYIVLSSVNVSIFHITWLDAFWTDLIYPRKIKTYMHTKTCRWVFTAALWQQSKSGNNPNVYQLING